MTDKEDEWEYSIREMVEKDIPEVEELHIILFPVRYNYNVFLDFISSAYLSLVLEAKRKIKPETKKDHHNDSDYSIKLDENKDDYSEEEESAKYEKKIIGIATANRMWISPFSRDRAAYLSTFGILPGFRRKKLGTLLLNVETECLKKYYGCKYIDLHMQRANQAAHDFYIRNGYHVERILIQYYNFNNARHDALYMRHSLHHFEMERQLDVKLSDKVEYYLTHTQQISWFYRFCIDP